jgi:hypothetical protein
MVDNYVDGRSLRFSNCYYYRCDFGSLGATRGLVEIDASAIEGLSGGEIRAV